MASGLVLDMDDTLIDSAKAYAVASRAALIAIGMPDAVDELAAARKAVKARLPVGHVAARNRWLYFKELLDAQGVWTPALLRLAMASYESSLAEEVRGQWLQLRRRDFFLRLRQRLPIVVITNENLRMQTIKLSMMDPDGDIFQQMITSEEVGAEKPDPCLLQAALLHLQLRADEVCVVGDSYEHDIAPALRLGCQAILTAEFTRGDGPCLSGAQPTAVIHALEDLTHYVC